MKFNKYIIMIAHLFFVGCLCSQENTCSDSTCGNHYKAKLEATAEKPEQLDNEYCDATSGPSKPCSPPKYNCLRAAVVEYSRIDGSDCETTTQANLNAYDQIVKLAHANGAKMILFPEDGILMGTAKSIFPCLEEIPDPETLTEDFNPCLQPHRFDQEFPILTRLSCLAQQYGIYLIANYGTKEKRNSFANNERLGQPGGAKSTQDDSEYLMLNTDLVFDPTGKFIKRYRKWNPFIETELFTKAPKLEHIYFDTDYGRFGVFTCFDMIFREPAIELVEQYHIDTAIFPTWWFDELPLLPAVQFQDGWSATNRVNMLASNILKPSRGSLGSSIFSNNNSVYVAPENFYSKDQARKTKILLGTVQTKQAGPSCGEDFEPKIIEIDTNVNYDNYKYKNYKLHASDTVHVLESKPEGVKTACSGEVCCTVEYKLDRSSETTSMDGKLVIIVRDGPRPGFYQWYEQVCALATLKLPCSDINRCDIDKSLENLAFDGDAAVGFEKLIIKGTFASKYVYPSTSHNLSRLVDRNQRKFACNQTSTTGTDSNARSIFDCQLEYIVDETDPKQNRINSFGLYGRVYDRDMKR